MRDIIIVGIIFISCSNNIVTVSSPKEDIEALSNTIKHKMIDSISISNDYRYADVHYNNDTINDYFILESSLHILNCNYVDKTDPFYKKFFKSGDWISDPSFYFENYRVSLKIDSMPFSAITYNANIPIDTLRTFIRFLMDSTISTMHQGYKIPVDSISSIQWYAKNDTTFIDLVKSTGICSGISYSFRYFQNVMVGFSVAIMVRKTAYLDDEVG